MLSREHAFDASFYSGTSCQGGNRKQPKYTGLPEQRICLLRRNEVLSMRGIWKYHHRHRRTTKLPRRPIL
ncbi:unnamed protein product [Acanthoscelides obtectus]|uniref:Uncharacterized protein n=1 Tax=Acanthoscelides obtectus TaxID=200917 RepID=A0A9P0L506_ACAOB|nr:unnamed protein product [Acanthoscelides obtectus]CAK1671122.1 hypothetical protein AOBTE_LOCUS28069 [Acanthoscelides obtectus]